MLNIFMVLSDEASDEPVETGERLDAVSDVELQPESRAAANNAPSGRQFENFIRFP